MAKYIGLMSGTSMDGVDAVLCEITTTNCSTLAATSVDYAQPLLDALNALCRKSDDELNNLAIADRLVAETFAKAVNELLEKAKLKASDITAIGSHGQTVRHYPKGMASSSLFSSELMRGFTCQIGDPNTIAVLTGIDVVADFRRKDIALGGQGAPLVPAYHNAVFAHQTNQRVLVNIGGIANVSLLPPKNTSQPVRGFDTGPGNTLMDKWISQHLNQRFDENGQWAASGVAQEALLNTLLSDKYFTLSAPKSTGREYFNLDWLNQKIELLKSNTWNLPDAGSHTNLTPENVQATLLALTATTIASDVKKYVEDSLEADTTVEVIVCGGGAFNQALMSALKKKLPNFSVDDAYSLGIHPQHVEGAAFAWLAFAYLNNINGNVPEVTGASRATVLGALFKK
jgi:anhydro-N-acetylmuramic acid kinase